MPSSPRRHDEPVGTRRFENGDQVEQAHFRAADGPDSIRNAIFKGGVPYSGPDYKSYY